MKKLLTGNEAIALAVRLCRVELIAAYPITPQTPIYEKLAQWEAEGTLDGVMVRVESEHSAMATCISAAMTGLRVFTASSSQGIALMHEMLHFAAGNRVPVVMACVNRALAIPWAFGSDQIDTLSQRDTGWIQFYCEDAQEALDTVIEAYKVSESVMLPSMVVIDGFFTSHLMEPVEIPLQEEVDAFLPRPSIPSRFDFQRPAFLSNVVGPRDYFRFRHRQFLDMKLAKEVVLEIDRAFQEAFGRSYGIVEPVHLDDAELVLVTSGALTGTVRAVVEELRQRGKKVGLLKVKLFRPFPKEEVRRALKGKKKVGVVDRNVSIGSGGIFCEEIKAALYGVEGAPKVASYITGLGGVDVPPELIEAIVEDLEKREVFEEPIWIGGI